MSTSTTALINLEQAHLFLQTLAGDEAVTFQTIDEKPEKRPLLSRVIHGPLSSHRAALSRFNELGVGVFVMVCQGDLKGRKKENVTKVRALFLDLDGAPLMPVKEASLSPHMIVESSPGRYHAYWLVEDCSLEMFTPLQKAIASRFSGDPTVCDLPRVMRVPGFMHHKGEPFLSRIIETNDRPAYTVGELAGALQLKSIPEGARNDGLAKIAGSLRGAGMERDGIDERLQEINQAQCNPPLPITEVNAIANSISRYPANKLAAASNQVFDYPAFLLPANDIMSKEEFMFMQLDELGLVIKLLCYCWVNDTAPRDLDKLAVALRLEPSNLDRVLTAAVLGMFEVDDDGRLYSSYLREQRDREMEKRGRLAANGRKGGLNAQSNNRKRAVH